VENLAGIDLKKLVNLIPQLKAEVPGKSEPEKQ
jgi:hypothetical protein